MHVLLHQHLNGLFCFLILLLHHPRDAHLIVCTGQSVIGGICILCDFQSQSEKLLAVLHAGGCVVEFPGDGCQGEPDVRLDVAVVTRWCAGTELQSKLQSWKKDLI